MRRYWSVIESPFQQFAAWVDEDGRLLRFHLRSAGAARVDSEAENNPGKLADIQRQVDEYSSGKRRDFDFALMAEGPEFEQKVWAALLEIPFGTTTSYGAVAKRIGVPNGARAVGAANNANPIALIVPCHRVIGADGSLTGYGGGLPLKRKLLEHEARVCGTRLDLFG
ncbi:MAG TPA: methylated-DNA--[protein]-cysteine S-methyltransferase [Rhizomicrobium sp.]|jgi:methylated-DNA-[protein]-cysteine S-methyltransferase|nr:methylated-DNA--[protein]-cysteine S-methyltransferase [Rhizomicrobium sp.]